MSSGNLPSTSKKSEPISGGNLPSTTKTAQPAPTGKKGAAESREITKTVLQYGPEWVKHIAFDRGGVRNGNELVY
jgi:hypothetical protein